MAFLRIEAVTRMPTGGDRLLDWHIDAPKSGSESPVSTFAIAGWVLGRTEQPVAVEVVPDDGALDTRPAPAGPVSRPRPDVAQRFPAVAGAAMAGFRLTVTALRLSPAFTLRLDAIFADGARAPLGLIRGRYHPAESSFQPAMQPLLVTSLRSSGAPWLLELLAGHPAIATRRALHPDPYAGCYLADRLRGTMLWSGRSMTPGQLEALHEFIEGHRTQEANITALYAELACSQDKPRAVLFAEEYHLEHSLALLWALYPAAREVILVRDVRDLLATLLAGAPRWAQEGGSAAPPPAEDTLQQLAYNARRLLVDFRYRAARAHLLRLEDLVQRPGEILAALTDYLGVDPMPTAVTQAIARAAAAAPDTAPERTNGDVARSIGRWQRDLSPALQVRCQEVLGDVLRGFGYQIAEVGPPPCVPTAQPARRLAPTRPTRVNVVIGGTPKGGTTALDSFLIQHPAICMASVKEVHFFDTDAHFAADHPPDYDAYHAQFRRWPGQTVVGEATPTYMYWEPAPRRIWEYNPAMKWILALRNPVDRAYSHWNMGRQRGRETHTFEDALRVQEQLAHKGPPERQRLYSYLDWGFYAAQVQRVFHYFARAQVHVVLAEELRQAHMQTLAQVLDFLEVDTRVQIPSSWPLSGTYTAPMDTEVRRRLSELYAPDIAQLERLLERDLSVWRR